MREKLLPPLKEEEWRRLQRLVSGGGEGGGKWDGVVPRRTPGIDFRGMREQEEKAEELARLRSERIIGEGMWVKKPSVADKATGAASRQRPHTITARFMRRLYARVFLKCNLLVWRSSGQGQGQGQGKWDVKWGEQSRSRALDGPERVDERLFEGVDSKGRVVVAMEGKGGKDMLVSKKKSVKVVEEVEKSPSPVELAGKI